MLIYGIEKDSDIKVEFPFCSERKTLLRTLWWKVKLQWYTFKLILIERQGEFILDWIIVLSYHMIEVDLTTYTKRTNPKTWLIP